MRFWHIYTLWGIQNPFMLLLRWWMYVCMWVNGEFDWVQIWYAYYRSPSNDRHRIWWVYDLYFFYSTSRKIFKALQSMDGIHLKCILMMLQYIKHGKTHICYLQAQSKVDHEKWWVWHCTFFTGLKKVFQIHYY